MAEVSFGEWLKRRRSALGLTQEQLALQLNCSTSALRKFESEERRPSAEVVEQLADIFNISPEERAAFLRFARGDWQAISSGNEDVPWHVSRTAPRSNLPAATTSFIGREKERAEIKSLVEKNRLVTLAGAGGIGKTRLSLETVHPLLHAFPDGVWFIELAPLSDPALVPQTMVSTLGLIDQAGRSALDILTDFLPTKRALLILDNCEHLIQTCAQLAETLLRTCPDLHMLTTSREALGVPGEITFSVPALSVPEFEQSFVIETLTKYEAVQLFIERARTALPGFVLTQNNVRAVTQVCHQLDGIPLALELAAARIKMMSLEEIASHLNDRFHLLTGGARTALPRHQTLQAMIDWSHDLLSDPERILLRRLSVFAGGWSLEAAESICQGEGIDAGEILDLLTQLLNKSLLITEREQGRETRYHMLETIRQYAREKLWAAGEGAMMRQQHLAYFLDLAERAEPNLRAFDMAIWLDRLETEHDNISLAMEWALESDVEAELRLASALWWFWHIRDHKSEGTEWLERALSIETMESGDQPLTAGRAMIRGKALYVAGFLRLMFWETDKAKMLSEESLALFQELGPEGKRGMAYALWNLGVVAGQQPDLRQMKELMQESLALFHEVGDKFGIAQSISHDAATELGDSDYERARALAEECLVLRKEIGDKDGIAISLIDLGYLASQQGDYKQAVTLCEAGLTLFRELGNKWGIYMALVHLGLAAQGRGRYGQATTVLEEALAFAQDSGNKFLSARGLRHLGEVAAAQGDYKEAEMRYEEEVAIGRQIGNTGQIAAGIRGMGKVAWAQGEYGQATQKFEEALAVSQETENKFGTALALYGLGRVAQSQGNYSSARALHTEGIMLYQERVVPSWETDGAAYHLAALAGLAVAQNQIKRSARLFGAAEILYLPLRFEMSAKERTEHDQAIAAARAALGEEAFVAAWEDGKKMTLYEAIALALQED